MEKVGLGFSYLSILTLGEKNDLEKNFTPCFSESTCVLPNNISVPLLMPLVTLMERQAVIFEGTDTWEKNNESCEIMMNHLTTARLMVEAAHSYQMNAERILEGKSCFL